MTDLRFGLRQLYRNPGFTTAVVVALAIGIGINTTMFNVVRTVLLRPLPYPDSERLVRLQSRGLEPGSAASNVNPLDLGDWARADRTALDAIAGVNYRRFAVRGGEGEAERVRGARATAALLPLLGAWPVVGRTFSEAEDVPGGSDVVVVSHDLWRRRFGADPQAIGRVLELDGSSHTVIGVMPAGFRSPLVGADDEPQVWVPLRIRDSMGRGGLWLLGIGRLSPGAGIDQARHELTSLAATLARRYPQTNEGRGAQAQLLKTAVVGDLEAPLLLLLAAVGLVLLIACANVANLLLARGAARRRELTVRSVLGAGAGRLVRQLVTESMLLALIGGAVGLLLACVLHHAVTALAAGQVPRLEELSIDGTVLAYTLALALVTAAAFGLVPALRHCRLDLRANLAESGRSAAPGDRRLPLALVVVEMALALVLLIASGLLLRSFSELMAVDVGFEPRGVVTLELDLPEESYGGPARRRSFYRRLLDEVEALPGVVSASAVDLLPFSGYYSCSDVAVPDGSSPEAVERVPCAEYRVVADDYFKTLDIEVLEGRSLLPSDGASGPPVAMVNRTLARLLWPDASAIGHSLTLYFEDVVDHEIVGVVEDVHHFGLDAEVQPEVYVGHRQHSAGGMTLVARTEGDPKALALLLRDRVRRLDPSLPLPVPGTLSESISESVASPRLRTVLLAGFAATAVFLAAVGMFAVLAISVAQRTREIGIRMALGARRSDVLGLVVGQSMSAALLGVVLGLTAALASGRLLRSMLYGVAATDLRTYLLSPLLLLLVALLASWLPARRASRVDPQLALRES